MIAWQSILNTALLSFRQHKQESGGELGNALKGCLPVFGQEQGDLKVAFPGLSSRLRRSLRGMVEMGAGFQPAPISTIPLNAGPRAGRH